MDALTKKIHDDRASDKSRSTASTSLSSDCSATTDDGVFQVQQRCICNNNDDTYTDAGTNYSSVFENVLSNDETLLSNDETLLSNDETLLSNDETITINDGGADEDADEDDDTLYISVFDTTTKASEADSNDSSVVASSYSSAWRYSIVDNSTRRSSRSSRSSSLDDYHHRHRDRVEVPKEEEQLGNFDAAINYFYSSLEVGTEVVISSIAPSCVDLPSSAPQRRRRQFPTAMPRDDDSDYPAKVEEAIKRNARLHEIENSLDDLNTIKRRHEDDPFVLKMATMKQYLLLKEQRKLVRRCVEESGEKHRNDLMKTYLNFANELDGEVRKRREEIRLMKITLESTLEGEDEDHADDTDDDDETYDDDDTYDDDTTTFQTLGSNTFMTEESDDEKDDGSGSGNIGKEVDIVNAYRVFTNYTAEYVAKIGR